MKSYVILGAGQFGKNAAGLMNTNEYRLLAFGDNNTALHGHFFLHPLGMQIPYLSVENAIALKPDAVLIGVIDEERSGQLRTQALNAGFSGEFILLGDLYRILDVRSATLLRLSERLKEYDNGSGAIAELGVYKGDTAWKLNALFPDHPLYLFDTFEGFDSRDISIEQKNRCSRAQEGDFSDTSVVAVMNRMAHPDKVIVKKGFFPDTASGLEDERYLLVSLDADLYAPLLAGLEYFYPRLVSGGMILLHDYNNQRFGGAKQAVRDYESRHGRLSLLPLCDLHGSAVILHP
jgi:O-methyltransferase